MVWRRLLRSETETSHEEERTCLQALRGVGTPSQAPLPPSLRSSPCEGAPPTLRTASLLCLGSLPISINDIKEPEGTVAIIWLDPRKLRAMQSHELPAQRSLRPWAGVAASVPISRKNWVQRLCPFPGSTPALLRKGGGRPQVGTPAPAHDAQLALQESCPTPPLHAHPAAEHGWVLGTTGLFRMIISLFPPPPPLSQSLCPLPSVPKTAEATCPPCCLSQPAAPTPSLSSSPRHTGRALGDPASGASATVCILSLPLASALPKKFQPLLSPPLYS